MATCAPALREALSDSISSGRLVDTKIVLFSRRDSSGTISKPRALYASSRVLRTVPHFNDLLFGQFGEAESKDFSEPLNDDESAKDYGYYSDSDLEEDEDSANSKDMPNQKKPAGNHLHDPFSFPPVEHEPTSAHGEHKERLEKGKVIRIPDMAFITFQAFLLYLYTNSIEFAPYGSEDNRKSRSAEIVSVSEDSIPRPSPKSIYRLADKYDVPYLKRLALDSIRDGLGRCDIVDEIFSEFSSKYDQVITMQINHLASIRFGVNEELTKTLCDKIDEKVDAYAAGDLNHAGDAMSLLWDVSKKGKRPAPVPIHHIATTSGHQATTPANWECVKRALIRSIREGVFVDRKYWTQYSKTEKVLRPVYLSSIVAGQRLSYIGRLVKQYSGRDEYFRNDDTFEDSDCEGGPEKLGHSVTKTGVGSDKELEKGTLSILSIGSFASWKSLFFYLCTDSIRFAPLKSQGLDVRVRHIHEEMERDPHLPPPCSPKVIHSLAVALDIKSLRDLAFKEVQSKITSSNVVDEFFSSLTSRRIEVTKMQYELLSDRFANDSDTNASALDLIKGMAGGTGERHAGALKFGLREGFSRFKPTPVEPVQPSPYTEPRPAVKKPISRFTRPY